MQTDDTPTPTPIPRRVLLIALLASAFLYTGRLGDAPVYLGGDEAHFAVHAKAIATDGRNLDGMFLPLFFNLWDPQGDQQPHDLKTRWYQPMLFYLTALELRLLPLTELTLRLPTALIAGVLIPFMTYQVALRMLQQPRLAAIGAAVIATSPTMLLLGRQALDYVLPLPFVLGWLWCLLVYLDNGRAWFAIAAGLLLGIGFYSYIAAWIFMPCCLAITWMALLGDGRPDRVRVVAWTTAAFAAPLLPMFAWLMWHPEMLRDTLSRYQSSQDAVAVSITSESQRLLGPELWAQRLRAYASLFDPRVLFVTGGPVPTTSLGRSGVVLLPVAILLPAGLFVMWTDRRWRPIAPLLVAGLLLAPLPAAFAGEIGMVQRALCALIFVALIAAVGVTLAARLPRAIHRPLLAALILMSVAQFTYVYRDYFTHYKLRSAFYYDSIAFVHVADELLNAPDLPAVYFSRDLDDVGSKWRFYLIKHRREDMLARTKYVEPEPQALADAPPGTLLVTYKVSHVIEALETSGAWRVRREIFDVDNRPSAVIFERLPR